MQRPMSAVEGGLLAGGGCLAGILGILLSMTIIGIPIGVPLGAVGGWMIGRGLTVLSNATQAAAASAPVPAVAPLVAAVTAGAEVVPASPLTEEREPTDEVPAGAIPIDPRYLQ